jgi:hypothetical protein
MTAEWEIVSFSREQGELRAPERPSWALICFSDRLVFRTVEYKVLARGTQTGKPLRYLLSSHREMS